MNEFLSLRLALDDAITYGSVEPAMRLAKEGLAKARQKKVLSEEAYFRGQIEILGENFTEAIKCFDEAIRLNPYDGAAYNDRALCMVEMGIIDGAWYYFDKGIEVEPDYATVYHNKGWLLNNLGRSIEAIGCFKKALELDPVRAVTYENLADAYGNLGRHTDALEAYQKALQLLKPGHEDIREQIMRQIDTLKKKVERRESR